MGGGRGPAPPPGPLLSGGGSACPLMPPRSTLSLFSPHRRSRCEAGACPARLDSSVPWSPGRPRGASTRRCTTTFSSCGPPSPPPKPLGVFLLGPCLGFISSPLPPSASPCFLHLRGARRSPLMSREPRVWQAGCGVLFRTLFPVLQAW